MFLLFPMMLACFQNEAGTCTGTEEYDVVTADGAKIHLHRHPGSGPPVLIVHGISTNHLFWDLTPERSLGQAIADAGYDAWLLDLRGHGEATHDEQGRLMIAGWTMDDYGRYDIPAAIAHIQEATGHDKVGYVGHSMGGMVAAIYNALHGDDALSSLVVVGSPIDFADPDPLLQLSRRGMTAGSLSARLPSDFFGQLASFMPRLPMHIDELLYTPENLDSETRRHMYARIPSPLSRGELHHLNRIIDAGRLVSADGSTDYGAALSTLSTPLLVISGRGDRIAPPDRVRPYYEAAGSPVKRYVLAGEANGFAHDYGHCDLGLGNTAPAEIFPLIIDWLDQG